MNDEWLMTEDGCEYKEITTNGYWQVIRFKGNAALYSFCPYCGYTHPCYKNAMEFDSDGNNVGWLKIEYDPEKEFNFCPMCGEEMKEF